MPISGPKDAINFQSFKRRLFERREKNFVVLVWCGCAPDLAGQRRTVSAQCATCSCVRVVRRSPQSCIHPINAINLPIECKKIYFYREARAIFESNQSGIFNMDSLTHHWLKPLTESRKPTY